jgi:hypothetical protein
MTAAAAAAAVVVESIDDVLLVQRAESCIASLFGCVYKHKLALSAITNKMSVDYSSSSRSSRRATHALHLPVRNCVVICRLACATTSASLKGRLNSTVKMSDRSIKPCCCKCHARKHSTHT